MQSKVLTHILINLLALLRTHSAVAKSSAVAAVAAAAELGPARLHFECGSDRKSALLDG